jgi:two-component system nitrogen regulation sensor histidine kinase NtrY
MINLLIRKYYLLVSAILCFCFSVFLLNNGTYTTQELAQRAQKNLHLKEEKAKSILYQISEYSRNTTESNLFGFDKIDGDELFDKDGISVYGYKNDSVSYWSSNLPAIDLYAYTNESNVQLVKIRNGWYELIKYKDSLWNRYKFVALINIKSEYDFENKYLNNGFSSWLKLPKNTKLNIPINYLNHSITSKFGPPLFEIYRSDGVYQSKQSIVFSSIFVLLALTLLIIFIVKVICKYLSNWVYQFLILGLLFLTIRSVMIYFKFPAVFYDTIFYDTVIYANASSFYFSYLGDIMLNSVLTLSLFIILYKKPFDYFNIKTSQSIVLTAGFLPLAFSYSYLINSVIVSLVNNSTLTYNLNQLFDFKWMSFLGLISVGLLIFSFCLFIEKFLSLILKNSEQSFLKNSIINSSIVIIFLIYFMFAWYENPFLWTLPLIFVIYLFIRYKATYNFINIGFVILISTLLISNIFSKNEQLNKENTFEALSLNLLDRQDVIAENEFLKVSNSIKNDYKLKNLLSLLPLSSQQIEQRLRQINFSGYFERYEVVLSLFGNDSTPVFSSVNPIYLYESYFQRQIEEESYQTISDDLFFIDKDDKPIRYVARINIDDINKNSNKAFRLYVQLEPKITGNLGTFPDILLDKSTENKLESREISYALYDRNKLISAYGDFNYPVYANSDFFINKNDSYKHYVYKNKKKISVVVTDIDFGFWELFTAISYLFILFALIVLLFSFLNRLFSKQIQSLKTLNKRIQFIFVSIIIVSLAGVVLGTIIVVSKQFEENNYKELTSKSESVLSELYQSIGQQESLENNFKDFATYTLKKLAQLFDSDITLYNQKGQLFASSQPALFEQGLVSKFMNPVAFSSFSENTQAYFTNTERIGSLNFFSAYIPFYSKNGNLLGYINLPYFSKQKDLEKELTIYLTTLINIYAILFVITILTALLVSNLVTKPLRIIKQQISNIKFGGHNEALYWNADDEIGDLVSEYNKMLLKLEESSLLLAKSERESAWREMAKQVAHEIKNPLTPMKLNIQHLQRIAHSNPEEVKERIDKVSKTLMDQIDTLTHIANEFSNFAKMPKTNLEIVNVYEVLQNITELFTSNNLCDIIIEAPDPLVVYADKDQCIRIFTNLVKNAEQSIPDNRKGEIKITANSDDNFVTIKVTDNGSGIPTELRPKIFTPNFTTKSTGTGLGLAMVKNSIQSFKGTIDFETELNVGTTFTIKLPAPKSNLI